MKLITEVSSKKSRATTSADEALSIALLLPETYIKQQLGDKNALINCLIHYFFSLSVLQDALTDFLDHQYRKFDALIGNNSCYATAYIIFKTAEKARNAPEFKSQLISALKKIEKLKKKVLAEFKEITTDSPNIHGPDFQSYL